MPTLSQPNGNNGERLRTGRANGNASPVRRQSRLFGLSLQPQPLRPADRRRAVRLLFVSGPRLGGSGGRSVASSERGRTLRGIGGRNRSGEKAARPRPQPRTRAAKIPTFWGLWARIMRTRARGLVGSILAVSGLFRPVFAGISAQNTAQGGAPGRGKRAGRWACRCARASRRAVRIHSRRPPPRLFLITAIKAITAIRY